MPGPSPKDPSTRARRNKTSTGAKLHVDHDVEAPDIPAGLDHPMTASWWVDVWASPMAPEYDDSDRHGLFALAALVNDFWLADSASDRIKLAAEIRQQGQRFGLSPIDRRRLQWEILRTDDAVNKADERRARRPAKSSPDTDPRSALRAVV